MAFRAVLGESHWSHCCDLIAGIPVHISCSSKASLVFPGLSKASHREETFLVPHSSCLCLHRVKETQSRERSFRLCSCGCALDVVKPPWQTFGQLLWSVLCRNSLSGFELIIFTCQRCVPALPPAYLPFLPLTFGSSFITYFMLKHSVKNIESKEIKGDLKWPLSTKNCSFLLEFAEAVAFFRAGVSWKVFSPSEKSEKSV